MWVHINNFLLNMDRIQWFEKVEAEGAPALGICAESGDKVFIPFTDADSRDSAFMQLKGYTNEEGV